MTSLVLRKIKNIDQKILDLKQQQEKLQHDLELKIIKLLKIENAFTVDFEILYGAIYELTQKLKSDHFNTSNPDNLHSQAIAKWRHLGVERLRKQKVSKKAAVINNSQVPLT